MIQCAFVEENEDDPAKRRFLRFQKFLHGIEGRHGRLIYGITIGARADGWKGDAFQFPLRSDFQAPPVAAPEKIGLAPLSSFPDRAHRVNHMLRFEVSARRDDSVACSASTDSDAFFEYCRPPRPVNGPIDTTASSQGWIGGIGNGVGLLPGNVTLLESYDRIAEFLLHHCLRFHSILRDKRGAVPRERFFLEYRNPENPSCSS